MPPKSYYHIEIKEPRDNSAYFSHYCRQIPNPLNNAIWNHPLSSLNHIENQYTIIQSQSRNFTEQWNSFTGISLNEPVNQQTRTRFESMETFSALLAICAGNSPVHGEFPTQRPVTRSFDVFFDLCLNKRLSKQSWGWWFETLSRPLWRRCNGLLTMAKSLSAEHYNDIIMSAMASQITSLTIVYPTVCLGADQRKYLSSASLAFV